MYKIISISVLELALLCAGCAQSGPAGTIGASTLEVACAPCSEAPILYRKYGASREVRDLSVPFTAFSIPIFGACDDLGVLGFTASLEHIGIGTPTAMPICDLFDCSEDRGWSLLTGTGERLFCHGPGVVGDGSTIVCMPFRSDVPGESALAVAATTWTRIEFVGIVRSDAPPGNYRFSVSHIDVGRLGTDGGAFALGALTNTPQIVVE